MARYRVEVFHKIYVTKDIYVETDSDEEAQQKGLEAAWNLTLPDIPESVDGWHFEWWSDWSSEDVEVERDDVEVTAEVNAIINELANDDEA
jgi:hypothetical protein